MRHGDGQVRKSPSAPSMTGSSSMRSAFPMQGRRPIRPVIAYALLLRGRQPAAPQLTLTLT